VSAHHLRRDQESLNGNDQKEGGGRGRRTGLTTTTRNRFARAKRTGARRGARRHLLHWLEGTHSEVVPHPEARPAEAAAQREVHARDRGGRVRRERADLRRAHRMRAPRAEELRYFPHAGPCAMPRRPEVARVAPQSGPPPRLRQSGRRTCAQSQLESARREGAWGAREATRPLCAVGRIAEGTWGSSGVGEGEEEEEEGRRDALPRTRNEPAEHVEVESEVPRDLHEDLDGEGNALSPTTVTEGKVSPTRARAIALQGNIAVSHMLPGWSRERLRPGR